MLFVEETAGISIFDYIICNQRRSAVADAVLYSWRAVSNRSICGDNQSDKRCAEESQRYGRLAAKTTTLQTSPVYPSGIWKMVAERRLWVVR